MRAAVAGLLAAFAATPALAVPAYDVAFVSEFADACVPQRMSYTGTQETALASGWSLVERTAHAELDAMLGASEAAIAADTDLKASFDYKIYSKPIEGLEHYLLVARTSANVGGETPDYWTVVSCYLYNFDATGSIDPEPVTALIGNPVARSYADDSLVGYVWGPPCAMPRTLDTYMTYVTADSEHAKQAGFSGLVLKFETSEPEPGEETPASYC